MTHVRGVTQIVSRAGVTATGGAPDQRYSHGVCHQDHAVIGAAGLDASFGDVYAEVTTWATPTGPGSPAPCTPP